MKPGRNEFANARILVVDDEAIQRALTRDALEEAGMIVEEADSGEEALAMIRANPPDLVLLDVMMPGIDGFEVCRRLRADARTEHLPVVVVTGCDGSDDIDAGMAAGASDFLTKPVSWTLLPNRIGFVLRTGRLEADLRNSRDLLARALNAKSNLLRMMSHELRTPMNAIIGFSSIISEQAFGAQAHESYGEYAGDIHAAGMQLLDMINTILEINDIESGIENVAASSYILSELVDCALKKARAQYAAHAEMAIEIALDDPSLTLRVDGGRIVQCLFQILSNAMKFNREDGTIRIGQSVRDDGTLALEIRDSGIGISEMDIHRVLSPFEQIDSALARSFEGIGLGLPLANAIAGLHGGELVIDSTVGEGTRVHILLPPAVIAPGATTVAAE